MDDLIEFLHKVGKLKKIKRTGWVLSKIPNPESVAEHSFRTAVMAFVLADKFRVNKERLIKMALVHDLAESLVGDITPGEISRAEKFRKEKKAMQQLSRLVENGRELMGLWEDFEKGKSEEAKLVFQLDKLEMVIQALEYEGEHKKDLGMFWDFTKNRVKDKYLSALLERLSSKRRQKDLRKV